MPWAWLLNLARSRSIDRMRQAGGAVRRREQPLEVATDRAAATAAPLEAAWLCERRERIVGALAKLPSEQREALECAFFLGLSHSETAARLGAPLGTVKTRIRTALQRLRDHLQELEVHA